jgi:predicted Zn-dependent protease
VRLLVLGAAPVRLAATVIASLPPPLVGLYAGQEKGPAPGCLHRRRGQLDALCVLDALPAPAGDEVLAAVTGVDLFADPLAYVFGLSALGSRKSIVSWARLTDGGGADAAQLARRLTTEVVHEVGHALGLVHCPVPDCAMHRSFWPEAVDLKRAAYCRLCLEALEGRQEATGNRQQ